MVNTFLPYEDFKESAKVLDDKRLYKQIVECKQILNAIWHNNNGTKYGYQNHPIVKMWQDYPEALRKYQLVMLQEWLWRRWEANLDIRDIWQYDDIDMPKWLGDDELHYSHRCNLLRKDKAHYENYFSEGEHYDVDEVEYKWVV